MPALDRGEGSADRAELVEHRARLHAVPGVVGTGIGEHDGRPCIKVYVDRETPALRRQIAATPSEVPIVLEEVGRVRIVPTAASGER